MQFVIFSDIKAATALRDAMLFCFCCFSIVFQVLCFKVFSVLSTFVFIF